LKKGMLRDLFCGSGDITTVEWVQGLRDNQNGWGE
jgi:hypothetical protein